MKTIKNFSGKRIKIETYFYNQMSGYGHWKIYCEVTYKGQTKKFYRITINGEFIDLVRGMSAENKTWEAIQKKYHNYFFHLFEESILYWCEEVDEVQTI